MKRVKSYLVLLLVGILLLVGGCTEEPTVIPEGPVLYSDIFIPIGAFPNQPHMDSVMSALVGQELTVTLGSNPTTGFQWSEDAEISDETIVQQVSHKFVGPRIDKAPGTPGEEVWTFEGLKKGTVTTFLEYSRPWIEEDIGYWTVIITTTIK
ncbi:hypothetical protein ES703_88433 [subsurface metagenome]